ncbi:bestrophin family ion channel [Chryseobacterium sp. Leaf394]|uniref:bestrophin family protein n=1 Tax=Chryseobacterium sp. Leaf394 TaxID=1736361 RepID=UPI0006FE038E|nr:bestrophin family ion channel [Chryseobacterium sp. Leaf394]KQS92266.1 multidrug transporter [Chryseobacterium sp. Leaf394]
MNAGRKFTPKEFILWTRRTIYKVFVLAFIPTLFYYLGAEYLSLPWQPVAILGTAVAFIVGFKNNASYGRLWEARQIYGAIINDSRAFGYTLRDALQGNDTEIKTIFYRHFAWLTALRFQLREPRTWENMTQKSNVEYLSFYEIPERVTTIENDLKPLLSDDEYGYVLKKKNRATQISALQSQEIAKLYKDGKLNDFQWTFLQQSLSKFTDHQGKAERIKNFPYPRNFSSITTYLLFLFVISVPFGLLNEFAKLGEGTILECYSVWLNVPFSMILMWVFVTLDTVGESSMNPFEGSANDVPITQISRTIEIDMRDMLDEENLPPAIAPKNNIVL